MVKHTVTAHPSQPRIPQREGHLPPLRHRNELPNSRHAVADDIDNIRPRRRDVPIRRHGNRHRLRRAAGGETGVVEEQHAMVHMQRMRDEAAMIQRDLNTLGACRDVEGDGKGTAVGLEREGSGQDDVRRAFISVIAGEVGRGIDLDAELGDVVLRRGAAGHGCEDGLLDGVGAGDEEGAVEEEEGDGVVEAGDGGGRAGGEALAEGFGGVVEQDFEGRVRGQAEALRAAVAAVDEEDAAVGQEDAFDHAAAFGHRVHFPAGGGGEGLDAAAAGLGRAGDVLVGAATADEDVGGPVVGAGEGEEDAGAGVGVGAVVAGEVGEGVDGGVLLDVEEFGGFGDEDEEGAVFEEVDEWVHVVWLVLGEDVHRDVDAV
jgi:hypothetical protein